METELNPSRNEKQIDVELNFLDKAIARSAELSVDLEDKLKRVSSEFSSKPDDEDKNVVKALCDVATTIRNLKDRVVTVNERLFEMIDKIEL